MIGQTISHYRILEKLGEGGMGIVYKAHDTMLDRAVALKFLPQHLTTDATEKERFIHEAKAASALNHPNITTIHEISEFQGQMFIVMEYCEGRTLRQVVESESLPIRKVLEIGIQICDGLALAHEKVIVHRDIKSDNIMLSHRGQVKIMDFGLAKLKGASKLTKTGSTLGTAAYMSPEQALGEEVDHRSDIFSFGVVLYELLARQLPFRGEHQAAITYSIVNEEPQPLARFNNQVSPKLEDIVSKALAKDRGERYQHVDDLLADLRRERKNLEYAKAPVEPQRVEVVKPKKNVMKLLIPASVVAVIALLLFIFNPFKIKVSQDQTAKASENSLAVMYFENIPDPDDKDHTGEMLTNLLITSLSQTKGLEVISRERLYDIQKELGTANSRAITPSLASQIAQRAGVKTILLGSILQLQPTLAITSRLIDVTSGKILASQRLAGFSTAQVFPLVDTLAILVRNDLKISVAPGTEVKSVAEVTSGSPEAYRSYVEGVELADKLLWAEAEAAFARAVELDDNFAMAHLLLSDMKGILGDRNGAINSLEKAWRLSDKATERERLQIQARYVNTIKNDPMKGGELLEQFLEKYPHELDAYFRLAFTYERQLLQYEKGLKVELRALEYFPLEKTLWNELAYSNATLGRKKEAYDAANRYLQLAPGEFNPYDTKGEIHSLFGEIDSAVYWYQRAVSFRPDIATLEKLAFNALLRQDYGSAEKYFQQGAASPNAFQRGRAEIGLTVIPVHKGQLALAQNQIRIYLSSHQSLGLATLVNTEQQVLALLAYEAGNYAAMVQSAQSQSAELKKDPNDKLYGRDLLAWALRKNGNAAGAHKMLDQVKAEIGEKVPRWQVIHEYTTALLSYEEQKYDQALEQFRTIYRSLAPNRMPQYFYAVTLLKTGNTTEAIDEFHRMTWWTPITPPADPRLDFLPTFGYWRIGLVKSHYWLGIAYEQLGQKGNAIKEYEKFLDIWKDADTNLPELTEAKKRLAALKERA